jgi:hypothetical protein
MDGEMRYAHTTKCSTKLRILFEICEKSCDIAGGCAILTLCYCRVEILNYQKL